ncbi:apolipoprotein N-acyltransferase [Lewinella marina]|uniref:Apolipoprotein N-acyltransferase n=1 Tax=Neolewinella marina TaxID=438751 RepID=A0A2G0CDH2_9BACT|nr:apolipoprotein N-acyltransferase [Neolewinella marina]NJB86029.1 apolipoprotein N-acyltransferase [Neolewinella marina]PHK98005.1 apolipoprotein N-acyltransferase [Neolewinella marina]
MRNRLPYAIGCFVLAALTAWLMYTRAASEELWGYLPLLLYLLTWAGTVLVASRSATAPARRRLLLSTATGLLLGLGFPGYLPAPVLLFVAWVPLLLLQRETESTRTVFWHGYNAFLLYNIIATFWVTNTAFFAGLFAVTVNSLLMCIPWLLFHWTSRVSPRVSYLALIAAWVSFEHFHYNWSLNWPWLTLGNGFAQFPSLVQWYEITGVLGGTVWILVVNWLVLRFYLSRPPRPVPVSLLLALVLPIAASLWRYQTYETPAGGGSITVSAIQPNFEPHYEKFSGSAEEQLGVLLDLSTRAIAEVDGPVDYLLLPETTFSRVEEGDPLAEPTLATFLRDLPPNRVRHLVTGVSAYHRFAPGEAVTDAVRYYPAAGGGEIALEALNGAVQVELPDRDVQTYRKGVFVPGAESFPFRKVLFFLEPLVNSLGGSVAGLGTQTDRTPFTGESAAVAPVICYESVFGEYFTGYVREGAQAAFVMTNDGWWDDTPGHLQHLWFSSLRAIETRRAVVRSANLGACAFIDPRGKIMSRTYYDERGYLNGTLPLNDALTPYVRYGDILARVAALLAVMALLSNLARTLRRRGGALQP